jgi:hypothetical protein
MRERAMSEIPHYPSVPTSLSLRREGEGKHHEQNVVDPAGKFVKHVQSVDLQSHVIAPDLIQNLATITFTPESIYTLRPLEVENVYQVTHEDVRRLGETCG